MQTQASKSVVDAIARWLKAQQELREAELAETRARNELSDAKKAIGTLLCPPDAKYGENFHLWVKQGDQEKLLTITSLQAGSFEVAWRR